MSDGAMNSHDSFMARVGMIDSMADYSRPSVYMRPRVFPDGSVWCALYGENLQEGVAGFGDTPVAACFDFDKNWHGQKLTPTEGA